MFQKLENTMIFRSVQNHKELDNDHASFKCKSNPVRNTFVYKEVECDFRSSAHLSE